MSRLVVAVMVCGALSVARFAWAAGDEATPDKAKALFEEGVKLFAAERYPAALAKFQLSYDKSPKPAVLYNLAMCQKALGDYVAAIRSFELYLKKRGDKVPAGQRKEIEGLIAEMREDLGRIAVAGGPAGMSVYLDGQEVGRTPLGEALWVSPGKHAVLVLAEGAPPFSQEVLVEAGAQVEVSLAKLEPPPASVPAPAEPKTGTAAVFGGLAGRAVRVGARTIEETPTTLELEPGSYSLVVSEKNGVERDVAFEVRSGERTEVIVPPPIPVVAAPAPEPETAPEPAPEAQPASPEPAPSEAERPVKDTRGAMVSTIVFGVIGVGLGAGAIVTGAQADAAHRDWEKEPTKSNANEVEDLVWATNGLAIGAGAAGFCMLVSAIVWGVKHAKEGDSAAHEDEGAVSFGVSPAGALLWGTF